MCGLEAYADAIVGSLGVEHRKRTTIGVELAAKVRSTASNMCHGLMPLLFSQNYCSSLMNQLLVLIRSPPGPS
jgi:hypothetical protein